MSKITPKKTEETVPTVKATAVPAAVNGAAIHDKIFNPKDLVLPSLSIRQNSYKQDYMKKYKPGDIILMPNDKAVASEGKPLVIIPLATEKAYRIFDVTEKYARPVGWEPWGEFDLPQEFEKDGTRFRRDKTYVAHVLLREGLESQLRMLDDAAKGLPIDPSDFAFPCRLLFTRGGLQAGKLLNTHFFGTQRAREIAPNQRASMIMFELKTVERENDDGKWFVFEVGSLDPKLRRTPEEFLPIVTRWEDSLSHGSTVSLKADESDALDGPSVVGSKGPPVTDERF